MMWRGARAGRKRRSNAGVLAGWPGGVPPPPRAETARRQPPRRRRYQYDVVISQSPVTTA
jgi:hypothetical protein